MNTTASNIKISEIFKRFREGNLEIQPSFQRKYVWTRKHRTNFIDTILKDLPFPEVYFATLETDLDKMETKIGVVDGQQRLQTIFHYLQGSGDFEKTIPAFLELSAEKQRKFLEYNIAFRDLGNSDLNLIREIFTRINQTKFNLNDIEIENAVYDGEYISVAKEISSKVDLSEVFSESNITRMQDIEFILLVMSTLENGTYFMRNQNIENLIQRYNENYPNSRMITDKIINTLNGIKEIAIPSDSMWLNKGNFFTLLVESITNNISFNIRLKEILIDFEKKVMNTKLGISDSIEEKDYYTYYQNMYTGTNSRQARVIRGELFRKYILN